MRTYRRKYKKWARHDHCEPYMGEIEDAVRPSWEDFLPYAGLWVLYEGRTILGSADGTKDLAALVAQFPGRGVLYFVPESGVTYILNATLAS